METWKLNRWQLAKLNKWVGPPTPKKAHINLYTFNKFDLKDTKRIFNFVLLMIKYTI